MKWIFEEQRFRRVYPLCFHKQFMHKIAYCGKKRYFFLEILDFRKNLEYNVSQKFCKVYWDPYACFPPFQSIFESNLDFIEIPELFGPGKMAIF